MGLLILGAGVLLVMIGLLVYSDALSWFGRLPGDIRLTRGRTRVYFPVASMIVLSVVLSLLFSLLRRLR